MFKKFILILFILMGFAFFAHYEAEGSGYPALHTENEKLKSQNNQLAIDLANCKKDKDSYASERDKAAEELSQIKALAKVTATQPSVVKK